MPRWSNGCAFVTHQLFLGIVQRQQQLAPGSCLLPTAALNRRFQGIPSYRALLSWSRTSYDAQIARSRCVCDPSTVSHYTKQSGILAPVSLYVPQLLSTIDSSGFLDTLHS
jgi:hypothetical protein